MAVVRVAGVPVVVSVVVGSVARRALAVAGGWLMARGHVDAATWEPFAAGAVAVAVSLVWSLVQKWRVASAVSAVVDGVDVDGLAVDRLVHRAGLSRPGSE